MLINVSRTFDSCPSYSFLKSSARNSAIFSSYGAGKLKKHSSYYLKLSAPHILIIP